MTERFLQRRPTRREVMHGAVNAAAFLAAAAIFPKPLSSSTNARQIEVTGTTFNHLYAEQLGINYREGFDVVASWKPKLIRLCVSWKEVEDRGYDRVDYLVQKADEHEIGIILAIGPAKAPRGEFYLPERFLRERGSNKVFGTHKEEGQESLTHQERTILRYRNHTAVKQFQIGNESTNKIVFLDMVVDRELYKRQLELAKSLKLNQTLLATNAVNLWIPTYDEYMDTLRENSVVDEVGLNIYPWVPLTTTFYAGPLPWSWNKINQYKLAIERNGSRAVVSEEPGEPWELNGKIDLDRKNYGSYSPERLLEIDGILAGMDFNKRLTWGAEFAAAKLMIKNDPSWANAHQQVFSLAA